MLSTWPLAFKLSNIGPLNAILLYLVRTQVNGYCFRAITWFIGFREIAIIILGIHGGASVIQHDLGAATLCDGQLLCFIERERIYRVKSPRIVLPIEIISTCFGDAKICMGDVDGVCFPRETYHDIFPITAA